MVMRSWDPFTVLARLDDQFDEMVRRTWGGGGNRLTSGYVPPVEVATDGTDVVVTLELPGVDVERDVDIEVHEGRLTISGERREQRENESDRVVVREVRYGSFRREFALPEGVTADDIGAEYDAGLLRVRVRNVARPMEQPRKVAIKGAAAGGQRTIEGSAESKPEQVESGQSGS